MFYVISFALHSLKMFDTSPADTGRKWSLHKTFRRRLMYVQFTSCVYGEFESFLSHISINEPVFLYAYQGLARVQC